MWDKILLICPSRNRPANIDALHESLVETSTGRSQLMVGLDDDNDYLYPRIEGVGYHVAPRMRMIPTLNAIAYRYCNHYKYIGFCGDDHRFRTPGWDEMMYEEMEMVGKNAIAYGNDLLQGPLLPTSVFLGSDIVGKLGYMVPPCLIHMYADNFWLDIGNRLGTIRYRNDIIIEHVHPAAGKAERDAQYDEVDGFGSQDRIAYAHYKATLFEGDVNILAS